ncbi:MAG TPA: helix-turn-helix transcriptional regulator [Ohtaekwangia sp.]|uniref:helix-turn-helix domain-containing protein n=1 Tax=Ohtaekwangia sp. TaxID=2066019 RepID=UPI002F93C7C7
MPNRQNIPVLQTTSYTRSYFENDIPSSKISIPGIQHFDIHQRCNYKHAIASHRLDFYMVFLVMQGEGRHTFGAQEHYLSKNMLCFIGRDVINSWKSEAEEQRGYFCSFSDDFYNIGRENKNFLSELPFFQIDGTPVLHLTDEQAQEYLTVFQLMHKEYDHRNEYSDHILRGYLHAILNKACGLYSEQHHPNIFSTHAGIRLLKAFTALYMRDFQLIRVNNNLQVKSVAAYAKELGVSQNHLNDTIKSITGRSAGQLIKNHLIKQATICLKHSSKSISEIAYRLGYDDPSYFTRYYKSQTGLTPAAYRALANEHTS